MKAYAQLCDHPCIQERWSPKIGDKMFHRKSDKAEILTLVSPCYPDDYWLACDNTGKQTRVSFAEFVKKSCVWLPAIEDLLGMIDAPQVHVVGVFHKLVGMYAGQELRVTALRTFMWLNSNLVLNDEEWHYVATITTEKL